jgi:16S rRNA (guanine527-N7)-methyltransferase
VSTALVPPAPAAAAAVFGDRLAAAEAYAGLLCGIGVERGVVGPREGERVWDRHLLNCATLAPGLPQGASVTDVGSGGGLPGIVLALARPDLRLTLVDSMARRATFLSEVVTELGLDETVTVLRARAEELHRSDDVVTARAVADPVRLAGWARGLLRSGGGLHVLCGEAVAQDAVAVRGELTKRGWHTVSIGPVALAGISASTVLRATRP